MNLLDIENMVSLKGMIIRCSPVIPEIREAFFRCLVCGYYSDPVRVERGNCLQSVVSFYINQCSCCLFTNHQLFDRKDC